MALSLFLLVVTCVEVPAVRIRFKQKGDTHTPKDDELLHLNRYAAWGENFSSFVEQVAANAEKHGSAHDESNNSVQQAWPRVWEQKLSGKRQVGQGAFGKVFVATVQCQGSMMVAVKELAVNSRNRGEIEGEVRLMDRFRGPSFITLFDSSESSSQMLIMMEAAAGDLSKEVERATSLPMATRAKLFIDSLKGIVAMHEGGYVHRDLKPANILVSGDCRRGVCHAKVADLGLTCSVTGYSRDRSSACRGIAGTPLYIAPETYEHESGLVSYRDAVQVKNDVWAMGFILYELIYGELPRPIRFSRSLEDLASNIRRFNIRADEKFARMDSSLQRVMTGALSRDPSSRADADTLLRWAERWADSVGYAAAPVSPAALPPCWHGREKKPVDCRWSEWSAWGACPAACDQAGYQERTRTVEVEGKDGGKQCVKADAQMSKRCMGPACPRAQFVKGQYVEVSKEHIGFVLRVLPYNGKTFNYLVRSGCGGRVSGDGSKPTFAERNLPESSLTRSNFTAYKESCQSSCFWRTAVDPDTIGSRENYKVCGAGSEMILLKDWGRPTEKEEDEEWTIDSEKVNACRSMASRNPQCGRYFSFAYNTRKCECASKDSTCIVEDTEKILPTRIEYWYCNEMCPPETENVIPDSNGNCRCKQPANTNKAAFCYKGTNPMRLSCPAFRSWADKGVTGDRLFAAICTDCQCCNLDFSNEDGDLSTLPATLRASQCKKSDFRDQTLALKFRA